MNVCFFFCILMFVINQCINEHVIINNIIYIVIKHRMIHLIFFTVFLSSAVSVQKTKKVQVCLMFLLVA